ncbi:MAG: epoxyqueuosine reductase [Massiliimalia sp.]|jgi:epoxyqueuosine reductase
MEPFSLSRLKEILNQHQIQEYGICSFEPSWGFLPCRQLERIPPEAKSVIVCAFPYYVPCNEPSNLCAYARVPDYHTVVGDLLKETSHHLSQLFGARFEGFTDVSPLPEAKYALAAGLGFKGKNGLVIHPRFGTYFVIGELVTDLQLPPSRPLEQSCLGCGKCLEQCPSGALSPQGLNAEKCLSAVTQRKGELTPREQELIRQNGLAWGCDRCQQCCPHNQTAETTYLTGFSQSVEPVVTLENLSSLRKTRAFGYRGKAVMVRNLSLLESQTELDDFSTSFGENC